MGRSRRTWLPFFLFGLGSQMQIIASLSFTELFIILAAPVYFASEYPIMRRNGVSTSFWLSILMMVGCAIACVVNHTPFHFTLRGMATTCLFPLAIVVCHRMLRKNMNGFKWMIVGSIISQWLCTYIFQKSVEVAMYGGGEAGAAAVEGIKSGTLFLASRITPIISLPAIGWYLQCPQIYCLFVPFMNIGILLATTVSGRSSIVTLLAGAVLIYIGGKKRRGMRLVSKYFWVIVFGGLVGAIVMGQLYRTAAMSGWLGEEACQKYMSQTKGEKGVMAILMGGRMETFCGLFACLDNPIVGFGPWAPDRQGYAARYLAKYGDAEDYEKYIAYQEYEMMFGKERLIPAHSHVIGSWLSYGIFGLIFWIYVLYVIVRYLKDDCWVVPQWYYWITVSIPSFLWAYFFSPIGSRTAVPMMIAACLLARAVRKGLQRLPPEMIAEISKAERK